METKIAIIGGSGLSDFDGAKFIEEIDIDTPFGKTSAPVRIAEIEGRRVAFLPRHGNGHRISPTHVPYRANIWALKSLGVFWCVTISAVGSLQKEYAPEDFVIPDQIFDRTKHRVDTFFDEIVVHTSFGMPYDEQLRQVLIDCCREEKELRVHDKGTYVCMEGPAFSTRAESLFYHNMGWSVVGMTALPEAKLAREAQMAYATIAVVTDYDSWNESVVSVDEVRAHFAKNIENSRNIIKKFIPRIPLGHESDNPCANALDGCLMTNPTLLDERLRQKYRLLLRLK